MCDVPLDLQRKFEQRWASRFARPVPLVAPERHQPEHLAAPVEAERKTRGELETFTGGMRAGPKPRAMVVPRLELTGFSWIAVFSPHELDSSSDISLARIRNEGLVAACIATGILWGVDVKLNDGRYSAVVQNVVVSAIPK